MRAPIRDPSIAAFESDSQLTVQLEAALLGMSKTTCMKTPRRSLGLRRHTARERVAAVKSCSCEEVG